MPGSDTPVADLWPQLSALLLWTLLWALGVAALLGLGGYLLARLRPGLGRRLRIVLLGSGAEAEPAGRRYLRIAFGLLWVADGLLQAQPLLPSAFPAEYLPADQGPSWFVSLQAVLARAWLRHPVPADVAAVWLEIGLGVLLLIGGRGVLAKIAAWVSIGWSVAIWALGESLGGLVAAGAGWLTGAPGAALVYALAGAVLLVPWSSWRAGTAALLVRRLAASWLIVAAVLSALPSEGLWDPARLSSPFAAGADMNPSSLLRAPIEQLRAVALGAPHVLNAVVVVVLVVLAAAMYVKGSTVVLTAGIIWCLGTWWLAQDFGVLGGTATDPNTALPLALLIAAALPVWQPASGDQPASAADAAGSDGAGARATPAWRLGLIAGGCALGLGLALAAPAALAARLPGPPDASAFAANSGGGVVRLPGRSLPHFALTDQRGRVVSAATLRGNVVVLTFLDPVCTTDCPLIGAQLGMADRRLGSLGSRAQFVAIDTNPVFSHRSDVAAFTASHYLGALSNWHFLWGPPARLQAVLAAFGVSVNVPAVGMIEHPETVYFADPAGRIVGYLDDGAASELTSTYAQQVRGEVEALLR